MRQSMSWRLVPADASLGERVPQPNGAAMTKSITRARAVAFDRQTGLCFYCKCPMCVGDPRAFAEKHGLTIAQARRRACTAEHLQARRDGGTSAQKNIVAACLACNQQRHRRKCPREPEAHRRWVEKRIASGRWHRAWFGGTKSESMQSTSLRDMSKKSVKIDTSLPRQSLRTGRAGQAVVAEMSQYHYIR